MFTHYRDDLIAALQTVNPERVRLAVSIIRHARESGSTVYILGNGGSAATASHFANDLVKMASVRAFALPDFSPTLMAYGNDTGWENMFAGPLPIFLLPDDIVVFISCSGNSANVVRAMEYLKNVRMPGLRSIVITGLEEGNKLAEYKPDALISVAFRDIRVQEDCHLAVCHAIAGALAYAPSSAS